MEYKRKKRWSNYGTDKCREYLRNDFSHECAYCKIQEKEVGLIDTQYFEIDHFRPQSDNDDNFNPHLYNNLYYSCQKCNREKSDTWSEELLDPCKDNIFSGENSCIVEGYDEQNFYKYRALNQRGQYYIDTFKLNSRYNIRIRKRRVSKGNNIKAIDDLIEKILEKISFKGKIQGLEELVKQLDILRSKKSCELLMLSKDENFELVEKYLNTREIENEIVFEDYNMDIKIKVDDKSYYCELFIDTTDEDKENLSL